MPHPAPPGWCSCLRSSSWPCCCSSRSPTWPPGSGPLPRPGRRSGRSGRSRKGCSSTNCPSRSGALALVLRGDLSEIVPAPAIVGGVSQREAALRFGEVAQDFFGRLVPILRQRLEEVDRFHGRLVVLRRRHQLVARRRVLDLLDVPSRAAPRILSDSSRHVRERTAGAEERLAPLYSAEAGATPVRIGMKTSSGQPEQRGEQPAPHEVPFRPPRTGA